MGTELQPEIATYDTRGRLLERKVVMDLFPIPVRH